MKLNKKKLLLLSLFAICDAALLNVLLNFWGFSPLVNKEDKK